MDPLTKFLYHKYSIAASNPLNPIVVRLEDGSYQQYSEQLKEINQEKYQWPMKDGLYGSDQNLHLRKKN